MRPAIVDGTGRALAVNSGEFVAGIIFGADSGLRNWCRGCCTWWWKWWSGRRWLVGPSGQCWANREAAVWTVFCLGRNKTVTAWTQPGTAVDAKAAIGTDLVAAVGTRDYSRHCTVIPLLLRGRRSISSGALPSLHMRSVSCSLYPLQLSLLYMLRQAAQNVSHGTRGLQSSGCLRVKGNCEILSPNIQTPNKRTWAHAHHRIMKVAVA